MADDISQLRDDYETTGLDADDLGPDPLAEVRRWLDEAVLAGVPQANAASLATAASDGKPSVRTVLLKEIDDGLVVYTSYESRKGIEIAENPYAALSLTWVTLHRQIRADGAVERVSARQSEDYWASRPPGAQLAAAASPQSAVLAGRAELEWRFAQLEAAHPDGISRPDAWGGYRIVPERIEFWQGRHNRLHDRIEYVREDAAWTKRRLAP